MFEKSQNIVKFKLYEEIFLLNKNDYWEI